MIRLGQGTVDRKTVILPIANGKYPLPLFFTVFSNNSQRVNAGDPPFEI
jgi:hypothetical protein